MSVTAGAFNDMPDGEMGKALQNAVDAGLINGKSESLLAPKDNATRAEVAAILQRFMEAN
mgnify:CR=1 FL=1